MAFQAISKLSGRQWAFMQSMSLETASELKESYWAAKPPVSFQAVTELLAVSIIDLTVNEITDIGHGVISVL